MNQLDQLIQTIQQSFYACPSCWIITIFYWLVMTIVAFGLRGSSGRMKGFWLKAVVGFMAISVLIFISEQT